MSAEYNTRITTKLNELANMLAKNHYPSESTAVRSIMSKIYNWREGREWNTENSRSQPDADHIMEELIKEFNITLGHAAKRDLEYKKTKEPEEQNIDMEAALEKLDKMIEGLI
jgi:hypothetical protein